MKLGFALFLITLASLPAFANTKVQFDIEANAAGRQLNTYKHTYTGEFREQKADAIKLPNGETIPASTFQVLDVRAELPVLNPETGKAIGYNFVLEIYYNPNKDPNRYDVSLDFGPGQPLNFNTRESEAIVRDLHTLEGLEVLGKEIWVKGANGKKTIIVPSVSLSNFQVIE